MMVRTANQMFNAMLRIFPNTFLAVQRYHGEVGFAIPESSPKPSLRDDGLNGPARTK